MSLSQYILDFSRGLESGKFTKELLPEADKGLHVIISNLLRSALKSDAILPLFDGLYESLFNTTKENAELSQVVHFAEETKDKLLSNIASLNDQINKEKALDSIPPRPTLNCFSQINKEKELVKEIDNT